MEGQRAERSGEKRLFLSRDWKSYCYLTNFSLSLSASLSLSVSLILSLLSLPHLSLSSPLSIPLQRHDCCWEICQVLLPGEPGRLF